MKRRKFLLAAVALLLVFGIGSTIAFLTDTDTKTNTFTIGGVDIELNETAFDSGYGTTPTALVPGETVTKDPKITNTSTTNPAYVFMKVVSPCTTGSPAVELFDYTNTPGVNTGWELMTNGTCTSGSITRIYSYSTSGTMQPLNAGSSTPTLFVGDTLTLNTAVTGNLPGTTDIVITGYGVQVEGLSSSTNSVVWSTANFS